MPAIKVFCLRSLRADADRVRFARDAIVADVDIVAAGGEVRPASTPNAMLLLPVVLLRAHSHRPCCSAGGVAKERCKTVGRVAAAGGVAIERINTVGRVEVRRSCC